MTKKEYGFSDKAMLDFLQELTDRKTYSGFVVLRESTTERGWRLHETTMPGSTDVREAIANFMTGYTGNISKL